MVGYSHFFYSYWTFGHPNSDIPCRVVGYCYLIRVNSLDHNHFDYSVGSHLVDPNHIGHPVDNRLLYYPLVGGHSAGYHLLALTDTGYHILVDCRHATNSDFPDNSFQDEFAKLVRLFY